VLQTDAIVRLALAQLAGTHWTSAPGLWHWVGELPLQVPRQASRTPAQGGRRLPRGAPEATVMQVPLLPVSAHAWHCPMHRLSQQTLSTHAWLVHSTGSAQVSPFAFSGLQTFDPGSQY
jgi:hypothetical protein